MSSKLYLKIFALCLFCVNSYPQKQEKITHVIYKVRLANAVNTDSLKMADPRAGKLVEQTVNAFNDVECELFFNNTSSLFRLKKKLELESAFGYRKASIVAGGTRYKNLKDKVKIEQRASLGETFNIIYPFEQYNWKITKETKTIGGYTCYKAIAVAEEPDVVRNTKKTTNIIAWFTPEIPASFGPKGIDGLPGLVLEGTLNGRIFLYMEKIAFNYADTKNILQKPKGGIDISRDKYLTLLAEKMTPILKRSN